MRFFYARVSSRDQNLDRQIESARGYGTIDKIYADKQSGKDFARPEYMAMKKVLRRGDEVVVKELDRLGRNKEGIKDEIKWYKDNGITLRILDVPTTLIDFKGQVWIGEMINNILIEVLGAVAEQERVKIKSRQREGIAAMREVNGKKIGKSGKPYGRPKLNVDGVTIKECKELVGSGAISVKAACERLGISRASWYNL